MKYVSSQAVPVSFSFQKASELFFLALVANGKFALSISTLLSDWTLIWDLNLRVGAVAVVSDKIRLTNDCNKPEDMLGKCDIASYCDLGTSGFSVNALGEKAPCDGLRNDDVRDNGSWKLTCETPGIV